MIAGCVPFFIFHSPPAAGRDIGYSKFVVIVIVVVIESKVITDVWNKNLPLLLDEKSVSNILEYC